jgi:hypothetical protein
MNARRISSRRKLLLAAKKGIKKQLKMNKNEVRRGTERALNALV